MGQSFESFCNKYSELTKSSTDIVTVTLVSIKGSAPQDLGARMIISNKGIEFGTVGGGKVEGAAIKHAQEMLVESSNTKQSLSWNLQKDIGMTCGGEVTLLFEFLGPSSNWNIAIFGAGHVSQELVQVLGRLNCSLLVIDSRQEWLDKLPTSNKIQIKCLADPYQAVKELPANSNVIIMTMGSGTDLPILAEILNTQRNFPYLGVIGSQMKRNVIEKGLLDKHVKPDDFKRFICPIGEDIGGNTPAEISISIVAQLLRIRDQ